MLNGMINNGMIKLLIFEYLKELCNTYWVLFEEEKLEFEARTVVF